MRNDIFEMLTSFLIFLKIVARHRNAANKFLNFENKL